MLLVQDVGEIHRVAQYFYSRSPLSEPDVLFSFTVGLIHVGENTQGLFYNSRSPPMNRNYRLLMACILTPNFDHFFGHQFYHGLSGVVW